MMMALEQPRVKPTQAAMLKRQHPAHAAKSWIDELEAEGTDLHNFADWYPVGWAVSTLETATSGTTDSPAVFGIELADATDQLLEQGATTALIEAAPRAYAGLFAITSPVQAQDLTFGLALNATPIETSASFQPDWMQAVLGSIDAYRAFFAVQDHSGKLMGTGAHQGRSVSVANQNVPTMYAPTPWDSWPSYVDALGDFERSSPEDDVLIEILKLSDGWDGEGSLAPSTEAAGSAVEVFGRLSTYMAEAEIEVDGSTGEIGLTWYFDEHRSAVSLTILANGRVIIVSALLGRPGWRKTLAPSQFDRLNRVVVDAGLHLIDG